MGNSPTAYHVYGVELTYEEVQELLYDKGYYKFFDSGEQDFSYRHEKNTWPDGTLIEFQYPKLVTYLGDKISHLDLFELYQEVRKLNKFPNQQPVKRRKLRSGFHVRESKYNIVPEDVEPLMSEIDSICTDNIWRYWDYLHSECNFKIDLNGKYTERYPLRLVSDDHGYYLGVVKAIERGWVDIPCCLYEEELKKKVKELFPDKHVSLYVAQESR